ncbi:hypothetical protein H5410_036911 [Solanum commersonii]|uniref:Uncharacterized protein n=1 Tax=Solanum commersonii TaxID=4109 RepID=A0A9J5Y704_SOLCO|nr:hypothetical protein H5410_036911 [Solanum commersonii]
MDCLMVVNTIHGLVQPPWTLKKTLTREANEVSDSLARYAIIRDINETYTREEHMHVTTRGPLRMDKSTLHPLGSKKKSTLDGIMSIMSGDPTLYVTWNSKPP